MKYLVFIFQPLKQFYAKSEKHELPKRFRHKYSRFFRELAG